MRLTRNICFIGPQVGLERQGMYRLTAPVASLGENLFAAAATICKTLVPWYSYRRLTMRFSRVLYPEWVWLLPKDNIVCCARSCNVRQPSFVALRTGLVSSSRMVANPLLCKSVLLEFDLLVPDWKVVEQSLIVFIHG
jgi:hypothetical protein